MESPYNMPSSPHLQPSHLRTPGHSKRKPWKSRIPFLFAQSRAQHESENAFSSDLSHVHTNASSRREKKWWKIKLFRGMVNDVRRRAPYYWSDWKDAWDYRVVPATIYMYFAKYGPRTHHLSNHMRQSWCNPVFGGKYIYCETHHVASMCTAFVRRVSAHTFKSLSFP